MFTTSEPFGMRDRPDHHVISRQVPSAQLISYLRAPLTTREHLALTLSKRHGISKVHPECPSARVGCLVGDSGNQDELWEQTPGAGGVLLVERGTHMWVVCLVA